MLQRCQRHSRYCTQIRWFHGSHTSCGSESLIEEVQYYQKRRAPDEVRYVTKTYQVPYFPDHYRNQNRQQTNFQDVKIIKVKSGRGGNGKVSFLREAGRPNGPPDGGDGGRGGSVYVEAVEGMTSLAGVKSHYRAEDGQSGGSTQLSGRNGSNVVIQVPIGTLVKWIPDPTIVRELDQQRKLKLEADRRLIPSKVPLEYQVKVVEAMYGLHGYNIKLERKSYDDGRGWIFKKRDEETFLSRDYFRELNEKVKFFDLITRRREEDEDTVPMTGIDLVEPGKPKLLLRGGHGGMGNMHFLTQNIRNPLFAKMGRGMLECHFLLELKLLADLGLVGMPNAGKSTLLRAISRARPQVGHWEFTTLNPAVGTISQGIAKPSFTVADIPGIIKGSSEDKGMGLQFLRHVERSGGLVFVVALDSADATQDLTVLLDEMGPERMKNKRVLVVATKADVEGSLQGYQKLESMVRANQWEIIPCSALNGENVEAVIGLMGRVAGKDKFN